MLHGSELMGQCSCMSCLPLPCSEPLVRSLLAAKDTEMVSDIILLDLPDSFTRSTSCCTTLPQVLRAGHGRAEPGGARQDSASYHVSSIAYLPGAAGASLPNSTRQSLSLRICMQNTDGLACGVQRTSGAGGSGRTGSPPSPSLYALWL